MSQRNDQYATRRQPQPDGTEEDKFQFMYPGAELTQEEADTKEQRLGRDPQDLASRLMLLGFYGGRIGNVEGYFRHSSWMIEHRPSDHISGFISRTPAIPWTEAMTEAIGALWSKQVDAYQGNARVLCNAADFFAERDPKASERLYKAAAKVNRRWGLPARRLAYIYLSRGKSYECGSEERNYWLRRALASVSYSVRRNDHRGERRALLIRFIPIAIELGELVIARQFAARFHYYARGMDVWIKDAHLYLAWLDFLEKRWIGLWRNMTILGRLIRTRPSDMSTPVGYRFAKTVFQSEYQKLAEEIVLILVQDSRATRENDARNARIAAALRVNMKELAAAPNSEEALVMSRRIDQIEDPRNRLRELLKEIRSAT